MKFELKSYKGNNYIEYKDEEKNITFNNAEYFMFDVTSEIFKDIMHATGGFTANMTTRFIKEKGLNNIKYIMLCCIPQPFVDFVFHFVYLDENKNILEYMEDNNYFDYDYFKKKFNDCIVEEGFIYDLIEIQSLNNLTKEFCLNPSISFDFKVEGKDVHFEDTFISYDFSFFKEDIKNNLSKLNAKCVVLTFDCNKLNFITFKGKVIGNDNKNILYYQATSGIKDKELYIKEMQKKYNDFEEKDVCFDEFEFNLSVKIFKMFADKMKILK